MTCATLPDSRKQMRPALFLDRDGVINADHGYVYRQGDFQFIDGIFDLCRFAKASGYWLFVVTNQAGIGRGLYTEADFHELTRWMCDVFEQEECAIDKVYFCPTHPESGVGHYKVESMRRKPNPGMILEAAGEYAVDLARSVLIGDKLSDIQAGQTAGIENNFLLSRRDAATPSGCSATVIRDLSEARSLLAGLAVERGGGTN